MRIHEYFDRYQKIIILVFVLSLVLLHPWINSDGIAYYSQLRSMVMDHDLQFTNEFAHYMNQQTNPETAQQNSFSEISQHHPGTELLGQFLPDVPKTPTGHIPNRVSFGPAMLWLPFFLIGHGIALLVQSLTGKMVADGYSLYYVFPVCLGTCIYGLIALILSYRIACQWVNNRNAFMAVIFLWFASPLPYYMYLVPSMAHTLSFFTVALYLYLWVIWRNKGNPWVFVSIGLVAGLSTLVRWQNAVMLIPPLLDYFILKKENTNKWVPLYLLSGVVAFLPQMIVWKIVYGSFFLIPMGGDTMNWYHPAILQVLFSSRHGFFFWHPLFIFSLLGLILFYKKDRSLSIYFLLLFLFQVIINAIPFNWWAGSSFGYRRLLDLLPLYILGLAYLISILDGPNTKKWIWVIGRLLILWNVGLILQFSLGLISHTEPVSFRDIMINQFTIVPSRIVRVIQYLIFRH